MPEVCLRECGAAPLPLRSFQGTAKRGERPFFNPAEPAETNTPMSTPIADFHHRPATIERNHFLHKSLSCWALNIAVGCSHACRFCYVPEVSTNKLGSMLAERGVSDPDGQWGDYVFLRQWQEPTFLASLRRAEATPLGELNADGNRAVMLSTTTDPYMVIRHRSAVEARKLNGARATLVENALRTIRVNSTLNVRILTRSPLARRDFGLMKTFGSRLLFGMSLPTLNEKLARVYEPKAPSPAQRLKTLREAKAAGLHIYVAMAPTYPDCDEADLRATLSAIAELEPVTIFHEPINIRAENVARIAAHARELGIEVNYTVFASQQAWAYYSMWQMNRVETLAAELGVHHRLHLWPDADLKKHARAEWLATWWNRISEWPADQALRPPDKTL